MPKTPEAQVRDPVIEHFEDIEGALHVRNVFRQGMKVGFPDDTFYFNWRTLHIEFKAKNKKPNRKQQHMIATLRDAGHMVLIIDNIEEGIAALDMVNEGHDMQSELLEQLVCKRAGTKYRALVANCQKIDNW